MGGSLCIRISHKHLYTAPKHSKNNKNGEKTTCGNEQVQCAGIIQQKESRSVVVQKIYNFWELANPLE